MPYTDHGHWYGPGEPTQPGPRLVARCGGPGLCTACAREAGTVTVPESHEAALTGATGGAGGVTASEGPTDAHNAAPGTWRTGRRKARNIYLQGGATATDDDTQIGCMDTPELGRQVVAAVNAVTQLREQAERWAALAPADDWGDNTADTIVADMGRAVLAIINTAQEDATDEGIAP